jgi:hypothetical protein
MIRRPPPHVVGQIIFLVLLVLSLVAFVATSPANISPEVPWPDVPEPEARITAVAALLTAVASLAGLVSTTLLGWRQEVRAAQKAERERQRHELEIEKLRRDLEARADPAPPPSNQP